MSMMFQRPSREFAPRTPALRSFFWKKCPAKKLAKMSFFTL